MVDPASLVFERLPGLFDRRFVVNALGPSAVFWAASLLLADACELLALPEVWSLLSEDDPIVGTVGALFALVLLALALVVANTWIIRRMEGYNVWARWTVGRWWERRKFRRQAERIRRAQAQIQDARRLLVVRASLFPPREEELLPTPFGNAVRAFEAYPTEMYGFEATRGWTRLLAVVPSDYRELVAESKSQVDLLANFWALSWLFLFEYLVLAWISGGRPSAWFGAVAVACLWLARRQALQAALRWGEMVKGAFDAFLPELQRRLGLPLPANREEQRKMWRAFSLAFLTAEPEHLPELAGTPSPGHPGGEGESAGYEDPRGHLRPVR